VTEVFGAIADVCDQVRPGYPAALGPLLRTTLVLARRPSEW
jgi:hypothetical protein